MLLCYVAVLKLWKNMLHSGTVLNRPNRPDRLKAVSIWSLAKFSDPDRNAGDPCDRDRPIVRIVPNFFGAFQYDRLDRLNTFWDDRGDWDDYMETKLCKTIESVTSFVS